MRAIWMLETVEAFDVELCIDAARSVGFGGYCREQWFSGQWLSDWAVQGLVRNVVLLKLFPILVAVVVWWGLVKGQEGLLPV